MKKDHLILPIHADRLQGDHVEKFSGVLPQAVFQMDTDDLTITSPAHTKGEAYVAGDFLIVDLSAHAIFTAHCDFCNDPFPIEINIENKLHEIPLEELSHGCFDVGELTRQELLLAIPTHPLCGNEKCLKRKEFENISGTARKLTERFLRQS